MSSPRSAIAMSELEVDAYLAEGARHLVLVTNGPDGFPDPIAMWFVVADGDVWMRTYAKSQKIKNLQRDPRFSALVEDGTGYGNLRGVQLSGRVELVDDLDRICDTTMGLLQKYESLAAEHVPAARQAYLTSAAPKQMAIRLRVERVVSWDHRKIGSP